MFGKRRHFGTGPVRGRIESTFGSVIFVATTLFYVGSTIAMFLQAHTLAA